MGDHGASHVHEGVKEVTERRVAALQGKNKGGAADLLVGEVQECHNTTNRRQACSEAKSTGRTFPEG